jgi:hypothetical protein
MKKKLFGAIIGVAGLAALAVSQAASAHVDVAVGVGVPTYYAPAQPVYTQYGYDRYREDRWREHEWRRHEWRERRWHHEMRREERWRDYHGY